MTQLFGIYTSIYGYFAVAPSICALTLLSQLLGVNYRELVNNSDFIRFLAVITSKLTNILLLSIIIFFKRKYNLVLSVKEFFSIVFTLIISIVQISIIRNIIYNLSEYYMAFIILIICSLLIIIVQYYIILYISKRNITERTLF